jgi:choline transport protein
MSEEVKNASTDVPRSMLLSLIINGSLAVGMLFAVLFSAENIQELLDDVNAPTSGRLLGQTLVPQSWSA